MKYILIFFILFGLLSCSKQDINKNVKTSTGVIINNKNTVNKNVKTSTGVIINNKNTVNNNLNNGTGFILIDKDIEKLNKIIKTGNIEDAEKEALLLYKGNKESIILLNMLGNIYNGKKEPEKAIKYLEEANNISKGKDGYILLNLGVSYSSLDKVKAKKYLEDAKKILPNDKNLDNFLKTFNNNLNNGTGFILIDKDIEKLNKIIKTGNIEDAEKEALLLYKENKESILLLNILGNIYNGKKEPEKAIKYLEEANNISKGKDGYILFNLGVSYSSLDKVKAKKYLEDAKKILPNDKNLDNFLKTFK